MQARAEQLSVLSQQRRQRSPNKGTPPAPMRVVLCAEPPTSSGIRPSSLSTTTSQAPDNPLHSTPRVFLPCTRRHPRLHWRHARLHTLLIASCLKGSVEDRAYCLAQHTFNNTCKKLVIHCWCICPVLYTVYLTSLLHPVAFCCLLPIKTTACDCTPHYTRTRNLFSPILHCVFWSSSRRQTLQAQH